MNTLGLLQVLLAVSDTSPVRIDVARSAKLPSRPVRLLTFVLSHTLFDSGRAGLGTEQRLLTEHVMPP